jgi:hypothetical protein
MPRSRLILLSSLALLAVGGLFALGAFYLDSAKAAVGPLPAAAQILPPDANIIIGLDVKRVISSPLYQRFSKEIGPKGFEELERRTGLRLDRDLEQVIMAAKAGQNVDYTMFVSGSFDRYKLGRTLEAEKDVTWKQEGSATLYLFREGTQGADAMALLSDRTLVIGSAPRVEAAVASHVSGTRALRSNAPLMDLLGKLKPGSAIWAVADRDALGSMPTAHLPSPDGGSSSLTLPALSSIRVTAELDPLVAFEATGGTADAAAAKNLSDIVRGAVALASMQAGLKPELKLAASAISISTEGSDVHVAGRFGYELFDTLQPPPGGTHRPR